MGRRGTVEGLEAGGDRCEIILVNDGSKDGTAEQLDALHQRDSRFKVLHFSRNFGHQVAITAGTEYARGETVTVLDADLQDPPELISEFIRKWREGHEVVYGVRRTRAGETRFKLFTARIFYRLIKRMTNLDIPVDAGDFRLMDRKVVDAFLRLPERHRYVRGLISWVGFKQERVHDLAVHEPEISGIHRDVEIGHAFDETVKNSSGKEFETRLARARPADTVDDFMTLAPLADELGDEFGRILEVRVQDRDRLAARVFGAGGDRHLMPEVT
jgi:glycosyltransferase involved in cell wall biosynthesis